MKKIFASFLTTRYDLMKDHWKKHAQLKSRGILGTDRSIGSKVDLGGVLVEIDWATKKIIREKKLSCPSGITKWGQLLVVASMRKNEIYLMDFTGVVKKVFSSSFLNDPHSLSITSNNTLLATSTGLDSIIEFNKDGKVLWTWFAIEHGYNLDQFGKKRIIEKNIDHRKKDYPTLFQTTHVNSVIEYPYKKETLLATFFHHGSIVAIDKKSGVVTKIIDDLINPHSIRKLEDGFIVSNTRKGEIFFLDSDLGKKQVLYSKDSWLQDSIITSWNTILAARSDHDDIIEIDPKTEKIIASFSYNKDWRIYQIEEAD